MKPARPALRYHGGKWEMAKFILSHMPPHRCYVEPFGGGASVLMQKPPIAAEIYNDLDMAVVNLFRVLQDPATADQLHRRLGLTPFSREEFERTYEPPTDEVDFAAKMITRSFMGIGNDALTRKHKTGFRAMMTDERALPAQAWSKWSCEVPHFVARLRGVVIENTDAMKLIPRYDTATTLFYCDPPYVTSTRSLMQLGKGRGYRHEMTDEAHAQLAEVLHGVEGMVLLSGYPSQLYETLYGDWNYEETNTLADGARKRVERLWFNPRAWEESHRQRRLPMEDGCAQ